MALPAGVSSHHTAWVAAAGSEPHPVRYAVDGDRLVCFGDDGLVGVPDRTRVSVSIQLDLTDFARALRGVCFQPCTFTIRGDVPDSELLANPAPTCGLCGKECCRCRL